MKIDLDLSEIFIEESDDIKETVKDRIVNAVTQKIYLKVENDIGSKIEEILTKGIQDKVYTALSELIPKLMDEEFQEIGSYGVKGEKTTVRNRILKQLEKECVLKDGDYNSNSDRNIFTSTIKGIIEKRMREFKPVFDKEINALFIKEALEYAQYKLKERLGIKQ